MIFANEVDVNKVNSILFVGWLVCSAPPVVVFALDCFHASRNFFLTCSLCYLLYTWIPTYDWVGAYGYARKCRDVFTMRGGTVVTFMTIISSLISYMYIVKFDLPLF